MNANLSKQSRKWVQYRLILFIFIFLGCYFASYLFFSLPLIPAVVLDFFIIIGALPSLYFYYKWAGRKNTLMIILILASLVLLIEGIGVFSGIPYGHFFYSDLMGIKIFGLVPWSVPFAFITLLLGTVTIAVHYVKKAWQIILLSTFLLVVIDFIIDPILVYMNIWIWVTPGFYYGVPLSNFFGWFITGLITSSVLLILIKFQIITIQRIPIFIATSLILVLAFWSGFALWAMLIIPFIISLFLLGFLLTSLIRYLPD